MPAKKTSSSHATHAHAASHTPNAYPTVLVHGLLGYGRDEILGQNFRYWGGLGDIQEQLKSKGHNTYTAGIGPLSSNWDRACELYAFLKGGMVDYGAVHSARHGHARYGRSYPGVLPDISDVNKIHAIAHSMGPPTVRTLIQLLEHGDPDEMAFVPNAHEAGTSDLFKGGKHWIHSLTSIAGVHNGSVVMDDLGPLFTDICYKLGALAGVADNESFFDFDLRHWGIQRDKGELLPNYIKRVLESRFWRSTDTAIHDLSLATASRQNAWAKTSSNVYYTSYAADGTSPAPLGIRVPMLNMNELLKGTCLLVGKSDLSAPGGAEAWRHNDGGVPVPSAQFPIGHEHQFIEAGQASQPKKGVWYVHPTLKERDHVNVVMPGGGVTVNDLYTFYEEIARYNAALPA